MATMIDKKETQYKGEQIVYDAIQNLLPNDVIAYFNREVKGFEFDFLLLFKDFGGLIIEVKGWSYADIEAVTDDNHVLLLNRVGGGTTTVLSPRKQVRGYVFNVINELNSMKGINPHVEGVVCYPFLSREQFFDKRLDLLSDADVTLFREDISDRKLFAKKIIAAFGKKNGSSSFDKMNNETMIQFRSLFEEKSKIADAVQPYSHLVVYTKEVTLTQVDLLLDEYFRGTKITCFVPNKDSLDVIANNLNKSLDLRHICYDGSTFSFSNSPNNSIRANHDTVRCFCFEAYFLDAIDQVCSDFSVFDGRVDAIQNDQLKALGEKTDFNYEQFLIEHSTVDKDIQIKAGAGTGKTFSMISRISFLCHPSSKSGVSSIADQIAMLTFTVDAANNMKARLKKQFMNYFAVTRNPSYLRLISDIEIMRISTIHSFASDVIKRTSVPLGIGSDFHTESGDYERKRILRKYLNQYLKNREQQNGPLFLNNLPISIYDIEDTLLALIKGTYEKGYDIKQERISDFGNAPLQISYVNDLIKEVVFPAEKEYAKNLIDNNCVNLQEYMIYLNKCILSDSFNPNNYAYKFLFIDEFQDVDDVQIKAFLNMQSKLGFHFFVVGDLKQSIYRFRGATLDAFKKMGCDNNNKWISFSLCTNYRSDARLLALFDKTFVRLGRESLLPYEKNDSLHGIKNNKLPDSDIYITVPFTNTQDGKKEKYDKLFEIVQKRLEVLKEESKSKILSSSEKTVAILVRTNAQIKEVLAEAKKRNCSIESKTGGNLYQLESTLDLCRLTSALCNPYNEVYLYELLTSNYIRADFDVKDLASLSQIEKSNKLIGFLDSFFEKCMKKNWRQLVAYAQAQPVLMVLENIYEFTKPWTKFSPVLARQNFYRMNYELLFEELSRVNRKNYLTLDSINESLLISVKTGAEAPCRGQVEENFVHAICETVHGSKGLEYDMVIMPETSDKMDVFKRGTLEIRVDENEHVGYLLTPPHNLEISNQYFIKDDEVIEQEREESRVLYVGLTRAINKFVWFKEVANSDFCWSNLLESN